MKRVQLRKPNEYFIFRGTGQSSTTIHAGSYHLALDVANIHLNNIMTYSSILPPSCYGKEVKFGDIQRELMSEENRGAVLECIMAQCNSERNEDCAAGIAYVWLFEDHEMTKPYIGLVVERTMKSDLEALKEELLRSIRELKHESFANLYWDDDDIQLVMSHFTPEQQFGTAIAGIAFINYN